MTTAPAHPSPARRPAHGATALGAATRDGETDGHPHSRHVLGNAVRALRVFAEAAFSVAVLGDHEGRRSVTR